MNKPALTIITNALRSTSEENACNLFADLVEGVPQDGMMSECVADLVDNVSVQTSIETEMDPPALGDLEECIRTLIGEGAEWSESFAAHHDAALNLCLSEARSRGGVYFQGSVYVVNGSQVAIEGEVAKPVAS